MFRIEGAHRLDLSNPACTSTSCGWTAPKKKAALYLELDDMDFVKPAHTKTEPTMRRINHKPQTQQSWKFREQLTPTDDDASTLFSEFVSALQVELPSALLFLPGNPTAYGILVSVTIKF